MLKMAHRLWSRSGSCTDIVAIRYAIPILGKTRSEIGRQAPWAALLLQELSGSPDALKSGLAGAVIGWAAPSVKGRYEGRWKRLRTNQVCAAQIRVHVFSLICSQVPAST